MNYSDPCEKVFTIDDLRLLILSFSLDKIKIKKVKKRFIERRFPKLLKFIHSFNNYIDYITFKIFLKIYYN
jgi:hypothetical protein